VPGVNEAVKQCREHRGTPGVRSVRELIAARIEELRDELERSQPERFLKAQGKIEALRDLLGDIEGSR